MADDFFNDKTDSPKEEKTSDKVKLGDNEYTKKELSTLVELGNKAKDWEDKSGSKFDDLKTKFGKRGERIGELKQFKKKLDELTVAKEREVARKPQDQLTEDDLKIQVLAEAKKFGLVTVSEVEKIVGDIYQQKRSSENVLSQVDKVLRQAKKAGKPVVDAEKLLEFMAKPSSPKDANNAYKLMFEKEIDEWKEKQLMKARKPGLFTEEKSTAGSKQPKRDPITKDNLDEKLKAIFQEG